MYIDDNGTASGDVGSVVGKADSALTLTTCSRYPIPERRYSKQRIDNYQLRQIAQPCSLQRGGIQP
ncbi:MAG: hypothetical protein ACLUSP_02740 [Christensenellales bacterium]